MYFFFAPVIMNLSQIKMITVNFSLTFFFLDHVDGSANIEECKGKKSPHGLILYRVQPW